MSQFTITELPKSEIKIDFTVTQDEAKPYIEEAVKELTTTKPLPGFRPGKATYEDAKRVYGEMLILEHALERIIRATYVKTILSENLDTIGSPSINVDQLVPGQDIKFNIIAPVAPKVTNFPDFSACSVKQRAVEIKPEQVEEVIQDMRKMRRTEARVARAATAEDLAIIDLEIKKDGVTIEGGSGKDYRIYLNEDHYLPGFAKELIGIKEGEERTFTLPFPAEHYQKHLAGQPVDFTAKASGVFELQLPEANDEFAKGTGLETMENLRAKLQENLKQEEERRTREAEEIEMLEKLAEAATFSDIPELLVNEEVRRMMHELEHRVEERGMQWTEYLSSLKKTADELRLEFIPQALRRIRIAILIKAYARQEKIEVPEQELDQEVDRILDTLRPDDKESRERVSSPDYRDYIANMLRNRKTLEWLRSQCVK